MDMTETRDSRIGVITRVFSDPQKSGGSTEAKSPVATRLGPPVKAKFSEIFPGKKMGRIHQHGENDRKLLGSDWKIIGLKISGWWFGTMEFYDFPFSWEN